MTGISSPWRLLVIVTLVTLALRASLGSIADPGEFIAACETNAANSTLLCSIDTSIVLQAPLSGRPPVALPQQALLIGAQSSSSITPPGLDLNASTSPLFAIPPHGCLTISSISLSGAALPTGPFPLPPTAFLSLLAVSAHPTANITLVNVTITTPSCTSLALQQVTACALSPSPNFTVTTTSLVVHSYTTPSLSATDVTLTCARPTSTRPTPPPCLARTTTTPQQLLEALTEQLLPPAASTIGEVPLYLFLPTDISLAGIPTPYTLAIPYPTGDTHYPSALPSSLTQSRIVIAGGSIPTPPPSLANSVASPTGSVTSTSTSTSTSTPHQPSARRPELDLGHLPSMFHLGDIYNRVVLRNLTLTNLPYGPVGVMPDSLVTAMMWSVWMKQRFALGWTSGSRLALQDCVLRVAGEELAFWAERWDYEKRVLAYIRATGGRMGSSSRSGSAVGAPWNSAGLAGNGSQGDGGALLGGPLCAQLLPNLVLKNVSWVTSAGTGGRPGLLLAEVYTVGPIVEWRNVLLTDQPSNVWPHSGRGRRQGGQVRGRLQDYHQHVSVPGSACSPARLAQPDAYQCEAEPGCDGNTPTHSAGCGGLVCLCTEDEDAPAPPSSSLPPPLPDWLSWPPSAHPLCQLAPAGVAEVTSFRTVAASLGLIGPYLLHKQWYPINAALPRSWTGYKASARVVLRGPARFGVDFEDEQPAWSFAMMQAHVSAPSVVAGAPYAPAASLLSVESLPAAISLRGPTASLTFRSLTLLNLPIAGPYSAFATNSSSTYPVDSMTTVFAPPDDLRRRLRSTRRLTDSDADLTLNRNREQRQESTQPADQPGSHDVTQGMPPDLVNFTSCLWMLDFDRTQPFAQGAVLRGVPRPAQGKSRITNIKSGVSNSTGSNAISKGIHGMTASVLESDPGALPRAVLHSVTLVVPPAELALIAWVYGTGSTDAITDPCVAQHVRQALLGESVLAGGETSRQWLAERVSAAREAACGSGGGGGGGESRSEVGSPEAVMRLTFARWSWCGVRGVDVTLTSEQPELPPETAFSVREQQPLVLPVNYGCNGAGAGGAGTDPSPSVIPSGPSGCGSTVGGSGDGHSPAFLPSVPPTIPATSVTTAGGGSSVLPQVTRQGAGAATPRAVGLGIGMSLLAVALLGSAAATMWFRRRPYGSSRAFGEAVKPDMGESADSVPSYNSGTGEANDLDGSRGSSDPSRHPSAPLYGALTAPAPTVNHPRCGGCLASTNPDLGHTAVADNGAHSSEVLNSNGSSCDLVHQDTAAGGSAAAPVVPQHDYQSAPATQSTHSSALGHCQQRELRRLTTASGFATDQLPATSRSLRPPLPPKHSGTHLRHCVTEHQFRSLAGAMPTPSIRPTTARPVTATQPELVDPAWQSRLSTGSGPSRGHTSQSVTGRSTPTSTDTLAGRSGRAGAGGVLSSSNARQVMLLQYYAALDRMRAAVAEQPPTQGQDGLQQQQQQQQQQVLVRQESLPAERRVRASGVGETQGVWPPPRSRLLPQPSAVLRSGSPWPRGPEYLPQGPREALWGGGDAGQGQLRRSVSLPSPELALPEDSRGSTWQQQQQQQESAAVCAWDSALPTAISAGPSGSLAAPESVDMGVDDALGSRSSKLGAAVAGASVRALYANCTGGYPFCSTGAGGPGFRQLWEQAGPCSSAAAAPASAAVAASVDGTTTAVVTIDLSALGGSGTVDLLAELGRGGQGVVYRGRWKGLDVAVKCCLFHTVPHTLATPSQASGSESPVPGPAFSDRLVTPEGASDATRAVHEAALALFVSHPNLVASYTFALQPLYASGPMSAARWAGASIARPRCSFAGVGSGSGSGTGTTTNTAASADAAEAAQHTGEVVEGWRLILVQEYCSGSSLRIALRAGVLAAGEPAAAAGAAGSAGWGAESCQAGGGRGPEPGEGEQAAVLTVNASSEAVVAVASQLLGVGGAKRRSDCCMDSQENMCGQAHRAPALQCVLVLALDVCRALAHLHGCGIVHGDVTSSNVLLQRCAAPQRRRCSPPPTPSSNAASATPSSTAALPVPRSPWEPSSQSGDTAAAPVPAQRNVLVQDHKATAQDTGTALFPATGPGSASRQEAAAMCGPTQSTGRGSLPPAEGATGAYLQPDTAYAAGGGGGGGSTILSSGCLAAATCSSLSTLLQPAQQGQEPTLQQGNTQQQQQPGFACAANAGAPGVTHKDWDQHPLCDVAPVAAPAPEAPWQPLPGVNVSPAADAALRAASGAGWTEELRTPQLDPLDELRAALGLRFKAKVCDFGLSVRLAPDQSHLTGIAEHSTLYASPELLRYGARGKGSDVYAFGVLLWELATGLPLPEALAACPALHAWLLHHQPLISTAHPAGAPQAGEGAATGAAADKGGPGRVEAGGCGEAKALAVPPELLSWPGGVPAGLRQLVAECLKEKPGERPSCGELCVRLGELLWPKGAWGRGRGRGPKEG